MKMFAPAEIISYLEMCRAEDFTLQNGMNYHLKGTLKNIFLMSTRDGAPFNDQIEDDGRTLIYEGHNVPSVRGGPDPYKLDQTLQTATGRPTRNGQFWDAAKKAEAGEPSEPVRVYEKLRPGLWVYNGLFLLRAAWIEQSDARKVVKFKLELSENQEFEVNERVELEHTRMIPSAVKNEVWKRDGGKCVMCGSSKNIHFDHDLPFSKGGTSLVASNIRLLCAQHNLRKSDRIE